MTQLKTEKIKTEKNSPTSLTQVVRGKYGLSFRTQSFFPRPDQVCLIEKVERHIRPTVGFSVRTAITQNDNQVICVADHIATVLRRFGVVFQKFNKLANPKNSSQVEASEHDILAFEEVYFDQARQTKEKPFVSHLIGVNRRNITAVSTPVFKYASTLAFAAGAFIELTNAPGFYVREKVDIVIAKLDDETRKRVLSAAAERQQWRSPTPADLTPR